MYCLCKCNSAPLPRVRGRADVLLRAADVAFNLRGNAVISIPWTWRCGTAAFMFSLCCRTHSRTDVFSLWVEITFSWIILFTFMLLLLDVHGCGETLLLLKPEQRKKCLHIHITSFESLSSLKLWFLLSLKIIGYKLSLFVSQLPEMFMSFITGCLMAEHGCMSLSTL